MKEQQSDLDRFFARITWLVTVLMAIIIVLVHLLLRG